MTGTQKTILSIADAAKKNKLDPIEAVREYFDEKGSRFPRARIVSILAIAREEQRKQARSGKLITA
jgi:hypothetical protein